MLNYQRVPWLWKPPISQKIIPTTVIHRLSLSPWPCRERKTLELEVPRRFNGSWRRHVEGKIEWNSWVPHTPIIGVYGDYIFIVRGMNLTNSEVSEHNSNNVWGYGYDLNDIFISGMNLTNSELSTTKGRSPRGFNHDQQMFSLKMVLFLHVPIGSSTMWEANDLHNHHNIFWLCTSWEAIPIKHGDLFRSKLWNYRRVPGKRGMFSNHSGHFHTLFYTVIYIYIYIYIY